MHSKLARGGLDVILATRGLTEPDGRGLHLYELTDAELGELSWYVQTHDGFRWRSKDSGALVLLLSEWGYRNARSASAFVAKAMVELKLLSQKDYIYQRLDEGLIFWKRRRKKPAMQAWNATILLEGSVPRRMPRTGSDLVAAEIGSWLSWFVVSKEPDELARFLERKLSDYPDLLGNFDDRLFWNELFLAFARYYASLRQHLLLPSRAESVDAWLARIPNSGRPTLHLPLRADDHNIFVDVLFSQLSEPSTSAWVERGSDDPMRAAAHAHVNPRPLLVTKVQAPQETGLLREIVARGVRGLPLYTFKLAPSEFEELRNLVKRDIASGNETKFAAARFCLYAAEQLSRSYVGGVWSWDVVMQPLGHSLDPFERARVVRDGLEYWQRPILEGRASQRLLMSLVREGGLPVGLLTNDKESHFKQFFRRLVHNAEQYHQPAEALIDELIDHLPLSLRNPQMKEVSAEMANVIIGLRGKLTGTTGADPIEVLNATDPEWQASLPLRVDDSVIREFISGLLLEPPGDERAEPPPIRLITVLYVVPPRRIERRASVVKQASIAALASLLNVDANHLRQHTRVLLSLVTSTGERHQVALARLSDDEASYHVERLPARPVRHEASVTNTVFLCATVGEREIATAEVPGGEALLHDVPWIFESGHDELELLAQGSAECRANEVTVLLPSRLCAQNPSDETVLGRTILSFAGTRSWQVDDERWTVSTSSQQVQLPTYGLRGTRPRSGFSGSEYWDGHPSIELTDATGRRRAVPTKDIEARISGTKLWRPYGELCGELDVRIRQGADTIYRTHLLTLPRGTRVTLLAREQSIVISSPELRQASLAEGIVVAATTRGDCVIRVDEARRETSFAVRVVFGAGRCELMVPSPLKLCEFVGREGTVKDFVVIDRLGQIRARAISPNATDEFRLEARVQGRINWLTIAVLPRLGSSVGVWELSLDSVRPQLDDFFTTLGAIDSEVEVRIIDSSSSRTPPALRVMLYEAEPHTSTTTEGVLVELGAGATTRIGRMGLELLRVQLRPLASPDAPPVELTRISDASWSVTNEQLAASHTWLITGTIRDYVRLRPRVLTNDLYEYSVAPSNRLDEAMRDRYSQQRVARLETLVEELAADWSMPEWDELPRLFETFSYLPCTTFDVLCALAREPAAASSALLRCGGDVQSVRTLWEGLEQLPFLWAMVPVSTWMQTVIRFDRWCLEQNGGDRERAGTLARFLVKSLADAAKDWSPLLHLVHELFVACSSLHSRASKGSFNYPRIALDEALKLHAQRLFVRRAEDRWPVNVEPVRTTADVELGDDSVVSALSGLGASHRQTVLKVPYLTGLAVGADQRIARESQLSLRRLRTFDRAWFDIAHSIGFCVAAGAQLRRNSK